MGYPQIWFHFLDLFQTLALSQSLSLFLSTFWFFFPQRYSFSIMIVHMRFYMELERLRGLRGGVLFSPARHAVQRPYHIRKFNKLRPRRHTTPTFITKSSKFTKTLVHVMDTWFQRCSRASPSLFNSEPWVYLRLRVSFFGCFNFRVLGVWWFGLECAPRLAAHMFTRSGRRQRDVVLFWAQPRTLVTAQSAPRLSCVQHLWSNLQIKAFFCCWKNRTNYF